jgi:hypothetical protein
MPSTARRRLTPGGSLRSGDHFVCRPLDRLLKVDQLLFVRVKIHFPGQLAGIFVELSRFRGNLSLIEGSLTGS